jgi:hypothetical protein
MAPGVMDMQMTSSMKKKRAFRTRYNFGFSNLSILSYCFLFSKTRFSQVLDCTMGQKHSGAREYGGTTFARIAEKMDNM